MTDTYSLRPFRDPGLLALGFLALLDQRIEEWKRHEEASPNTTYAILRELQLIRDRVTNEAG